MNSESFNDIKEKITNAAFVKNGQCFLMIDASLAQYQSDFLLYDILKGYKYYPVTFHQNELQGALPLFLYPLNSLNERDNELLNSSISHSLNELKIEKLDLGEGRSVCAWISTELTGEQLAEQIALTAIQLIQSVGDILLRYFDPSVFGSLMIILDSWQRQQLLSNINTWSYLDGDGIVHIVNGDGESKKKLNYSLGLTDLNVTEINRILVVNKILREYRKMDIADKLIEHEAVRLLYVALGYFYSSFSTSNNEVIDFGIDVLISKRLFYQNEAFDKYMSDYRLKDPQSYSYIKSRINGQIC